MTSTQTRRTFLAGAGGLAILGTAGTAAAEEPPADSPVDHVDHITAVRDDLAELRDYATKLYVPSPQVRQTRSDTTGQYGWIAESDAYDVTAFYYWTRSTTQRSALWHLGIDDFGPEKHFLDHEPDIVFVNDDGTVDSVVTTGGHHLAVEIDGETGHLTEDRVAGKRTHANLQVVRPYNHRVEAPTDVEGTFVESYAEFGSWLDKRGTWYRNGRYSKTATEAIEDPFAFYDDGDQDPRTHWWVEGSLDEWLAKHVYRRRVNTGDLRIEE